MSGERVTVVPAFELDQSVLDELEAVTTEVERAFVALATVARRSGAVWAAIEASANEWLPSHDETVAVLIPRLRDLSEVAGDFEGINETLIGCSGAVDLDEIEARAEKIRSRQT